MNKKTVTIALLVFISCIATISSIILGILYLSEKNNKDYNSHNDESSMYMMHDLIDDMPVDSLSSIEERSLIQMREEEKLARDVYLTLYDKWGEQIFKNIARSEQTHTDSVKELLDRYSIDDPVKEDTVGVFTDDEISNLYETLVSKGEKSLVDALEVGATIEDLDIFDLNDFLSQIDNEDIKFVYNTLKNGAYNHMRAFTRVLEMNGGQYTPQYISQEEYDEILSSSNGNGRWNN